jgi:hypothetical protein
MTDEQILDLLPRIAAVGAQTEASLQRLVTILRERRVTWARIAPPSGSPGSPRGSGSPARRSPGGQAGAVLLRKLADQAGLTGALGPALARGGEVAADRPGCRAGEHVGGDRAADAFLTTLRGAEQASTCCVYGRILRTVAA